MSYVYADIPESIFTYFYLYSASGYFVPLIIRTIRIRDKG